MSHPLLNVVDLTIEREGSCLFPPVAFALTEGSLLQVCGSNGSGKSSLLKALCGFISPAQGEVYWKGDLINCQAGFSYAKANYLFHSELIYLSHCNGLKPELTLIENMRMLSILGFKKNQFTEEEVLDQIGLKSQQSKPVRQLSAGQQRRVSLARLILLKAKLWILDEPFSALDKASIHFFEKIIQRHVKNGGAVILTTHHPLDLAQLMPNQVTKVFLDAS